jgi:hypothetical protein
MKKTEVYLDDVREAPDSWRRVYWPDEAFALLQSGSVTEISLDHDLGDDSRGTGYDVVRWIEEAVVTRHFVPPKIVVHSANPVNGSNDCLSLFLGLRWSWVRNSEYDVYTI